VGRFSAPIFSKMRRKKKKKKREMKRSGTNCARKQNKTRVFAFSRRLPRYATFSFLYVYLFVVCFKTRVRALVLLRLNLYFRVLNPKLRKALLLLKMTNTIKRGKNETTRRVVAVPVSRVRRATSEPRVRFFFFFFFFFVAFPPARRWQRL